ncbi:hypothetical protein DENSPDRAFT_839008 [Dentipellis sp. KUC8613]|nr:hypothetical protein DENSPDRAFT_839008 [Dentipellis sp. KUC8613]
MRYAVPRSSSPSPARPLTNASPSAERRHEARRVRRREERRSSTFGLSLLSDSEFTEGSSSDESDDSFMYKSEADVPPPAPRSRRTKLTPAQRGYVDDTVAAIRLRTRHHDPYEEWERQTRKDAFHSARRQQAADRTHQAQALSEARSQATERQAAALAEELDTVKNQLAKVKLEQSREENEMEAAWKDRKGRLQKRIENVIKEEEEKLRVKLELERKAREEEERKRKEAEERARLAEQRQREEQERKAKEEEERKKQQQLEEEQRRKEEELERARKEQLDKESEERKALGMSTSEDDWVAARQTLKRLKAGPMATVKGNKDLKKLWNEQRRKIIPKVGQVTNDDNSINTISQQIFEICRPPTGQLPADVYLALLSSLAKIILLQAETEVTAEKRSAGPLARVAVNLLSALEHFGDIFWAKLCQRAGGWPVPASVPAADVDGHTFTDAERTKVRGYREGETSAERAARVAGLLRVYFSILLLPAPQPLPRPFQLPRYWAYFARMLAQPRLLDAPLAAELLAVALDVGGTKACEIWGQQWVKLMALLYEGVTNGLAGSGRLIGGSTPDGKAARVRVQLEVERVLGGGR